MTPWRAKIIWLCRFVSAAFLLVSSAYSILAYIPFTYFSFIQSPPLWWMPVLAKYQHLAFAAVVLLLAWELGRRQPASWLDRGGAILLVGLAVWAFFTEPLQRNGQDVRSFGWALLFLVPIAISYWPRSGWPLIEPPSFRQTAGAAVTLAGVSALTTLARLTLQIGPGAVGPTEAVLALWSLVLHLLLAGTFVGLLRSAVSLGPRLRLTGWALIWIGGALLVKNDIFVLLNFRTRAALIYAFSLSLAVMLAAIDAVPGRWRSLRLNAPAPALLLVLGLLFFVSPTYIALFDWNQLLSRLWALLVILMVFACARIVFAAPEVAASGRPWRPLAVALACAGALAAIIATRPLWPRMFLDRATPIDEVVQNYAVFDLSFAAMDAFLPRDWYEACDDYCDFLKSHTNIGLQVTVPNIDLLPGMRRDMAPSPHIFLFVIDAMRRDYVSPYNPKVDFTPHIGAFAKDAVVMENAFTAYAGTSLAVPSIWAGAMQLHKHFLLPFDPINNLQRLAIAHNYEGYVLREPLARLLLGQKPWFHYLQNDVLNWPQLEFCAGIHELQQRLGNEWDRTRPVLVYMQPSNVHGRHLAEVGSAFTFARGGFEVKRAQELKKLDACFGDFIAFLKSERLYDDSVIVLTSDHGEALGEQGRIGHSTTLAPPAIRIPLIVKLARTQRSLVADTLLVSSNIDIVPSLYYLLGHRGMDRDEIFGRPLFTESLNEQRAYAPESRLIVSDSIALYGLLAENGSQLYVVDEFRNGEALYDLRKDPEAARNILDAGSQAKYRAQVIAKVTHLSEKYGFSLKTRKLARWLEQ